MSLRKLPYRPETPEQEEQDLGYRIHDAGHDGPAFILGPRRGAGLGTHANGTSPAAFALGSTDPFAISPP